jgi:hypothetical protein
MLVLDQYTTCFFGDDQARQDQSALPDLNELVLEHLAEEIQITQNAP